MRLPHSLLLISMLIAQPTQAAPLSQLDAKIVDLLVDTKAKTASEKKKLACSLMKSLKSYENGPGLSEHLKNRYEATRCSLFTFGASGKTILPCAEKLTEYFAKVESAPKSKDGIQGVFFLQDSAKNYNYVLKVEDYEGAAYETKVSNELYRLYGFRAPLTEIIEKEGVCGTAIDKLMTQLVIPEQLSQFKNQENKAENFIFMAKAEGSPFLQLADEKKVELLKDKNFIRSLGELFMQDVFLGNGDRMAKSLNMGNLFIDSDNSLITIDNAFKTHQSHDFNTAKEFIEGLASKIAYQYVASTLRKFEKYKGVNFGLNGNEGDANNSFVLEFLKGIKSQRDQIVKITETPAFKKMRKNDSHLANLQILSKQLKEWQKAQ